MTAETTTLDPGLAERERVLRILRAHEADIRARGVTRLRLFGSMARGEAGPESDVDLLIGTDPDSRFSPIKMVFGARGVVKALAGCASLSDRTIQRLDREP